MAIRTGDRQLIKELNITLVMNEIRRHEPISRVELANRTGLGRSTITGIITTLLGEGLVAETGSASTPSGRKPVLLTFVARARFAIGVKLGPTLATIALVDMNAVVLDSEEVPFKPTRGADEVVTGIVGGVATLLHRTSVSMKKVLGLGLVMPGVIDPMSGTAITSYFLNWDQFPIRDVLERELNLPVYVDNDANAMALAEALYGAGREAQDLLALTVGVGIGTGVIIDRKIHRGTRFGAGEIGHVCVIRDGPLCACGRRGCLEAVAADAAIVRQAMAEVKADRAPLLRSLCRGHAELLTREMVVEAAQEGEPAARHILAEAGRWLGIALGNAVNLLSPSLIVVGGEAALEAGDLILEPMRESLAEVVYPSSPRGLPLVRAELGRNAWVQGAAALVLADAFQVPLHQENALPTARWVWQVNA